MPYPNFHAARIHNPDKYSRIRYDKDAGGPGIDFILGFPREGGASEIQAIRFDASKFTESQAKKWISDHNGLKAMSFEPANGEDKKDFAEDSKIADWIPIAKTGKFPQGDLTEKLFDEMVSNFDPKKHEPPHVFGHITAAHNTAPALGWIESIKRSGEMLYAKSKQIAGELDAAVRNGLFKKRSIAIRYDEEGKPYLHHLAWLGATVPAVKGLPDVYSDFTVLSYSDENHKSQKLFDSQISNLNPKGQKMKEYSELEITALQEKAARDAISASEKKYADDLAAGIETAKKETEAQVRARVEAEFAERATAEKAKIEHRGKVDSFINKAVEDGLITPAQVKTGIREVLFSLAAPAAIEYKEGETVVKTDAFQILKNFIAAYSEGGTEEEETQGPAEGAKGKEAVYSEDKKAAEKLMIEDKTLTFGAALKKVMGAKK